MWLYSWEGVGILNKDKYLSKLKHIGIFRLSDAKKLGVPQRTLSWLVEKGEVTKIGFDAYHHKDLNIAPEDAEFGAACLLLGESSYIGGASALFFYNLINQAPHQIWIVVPSKVTSHNKLYRLIRTKENLSIGIAQHEWFRIASIERSILDAFHFQSKIGGIEMALRAGKTAIKEHSIKTNDLLNLAREIGWERDILKHWEAIIIE